MKKFYSQKIYAEKLSEKTFAARLEANRDS